MRTSTFRTSTRPSPARRAPCLLFISLALLLAACVSGPNLRALNPDEAKIDVYADGTVHVLGEPVAMGDLSGIVKGSTTQPADTILIRLHGDPDSPEFTELRKYVTDQMIRAGHYKFRFFSTPQASLSTYDPVNGHSEVVVKGLEVRRYSGKEGLAEAAREAAAEQAAIANGTYVSPAIHYKTATAATKDTGLSINPQTVQDPQAVDVKSAPGAAKDAAAKPLDDETSLRARYLRQQRQFRIRKK